MSESGQKKHPPSARKLRRAREEGNVAQSATLTAAAGVLVLSAGLGWSLPAVSRALIEGSAPILRGAAEGQDLAAGLKGSGRLALSVAVALMPALAATLVSTVVVAFLQVGPVVSAKALAPKPERLNPIEGLKNRIFSARAMFELARNAMTVVALGVVLGLIAWDGLREVLALPHVDPGTAAATLGRTPIRLLWWGGVAFAAIGVVDLIWQRHRHRTDLMMTDKEIADEHREDEGDPEVRKARKRRHRQILQENALDQARRASFILRNPTHVACAVLYEPDEHPLPRVIAKGRDLMALRMVDIARDHGVEMVEDVPLARALYRLPVGEPVPPEMIAAVIEILRQVQERMIQRGEMPRWLASAREAWSPDERADFDAHLARIRRRVAEGLPADPDGDCS